MRGQGKRDQENTFLVVLGSDLGGNVPEWVQLLPSGQVHSVKGDFKVDDESASSIIDYYKSRENDIVIDYEHQTLDGVEAPAAGWIKEIENRGKEGIWAKVEWTERAQQYIASKEYRYLSPVVMVRKKDHKAVAIHSVGLTNAPAISGMRPIINKINEENEEDDKMSEFLKNLAALLGLEGEPDEAKVMETVKSLVEKGESGGGGDVVANKEVLQLLDLKEDATLEEVKGKVIALKNPSGYVKVEEFRALEEKLKKQECEDLVQMALSQGKVAPAMKAWAEEYAIKDPAGFKAFLEQAPQVVPLNQIAGNDKVEKGGDLSEADKVVCKQLGLSEETLKKYGGEQ